MRRAALILAALVLALVAASSAVARTSQVRVTLTQPARQLAVLDRLGLDVTHNVTPRWADVILHSARDRARLVDNGFVFRTTIADLRAASTSARSTERRRAKAGQLSGLPSGRVSYRVPADYDTGLAAVVGGHPGLARPVQLPRTSVEGRDIRGVEIASNVNAVGDGRPAYVVMGLHHAREWPSGEVSMEFALDLAKGYGVDPRVTALLDKARVFVFPVINVDGFQVSRGTIPGGAPGPSPLKRRNCRAIGTDDRAASCASKRGIDLNRNYGAYWGGNGASVSEDDDTYRGPGPWSEPESAAVHEFSQHLQITDMQSIHNVAALVLRPPGFKALGLAPDEDPLKTLGDAMGASTGYSSEYGYQLYEVTGATEDWNYVAQGAFGYTIELGGEPGNQTPTFQGPYQTHVVDQYLGSAAAGTTGRGVREALLLAGEQAANPGDHAIVQGSAPAGSVLRLHKSFPTTTSPICTTDVTNPQGDCAVTTPAFTVDDFLDTTLTVPASGSFTWQLNPSTRPFERKAGRTEAWTLTCEAPAGQVVATKTLVIGRGEMATVDPCSGSSQPVVAAQPGAEQTGNGKLPGTTLGPFARPAPAVRAPAGLRVVVGRVRIGDRTLARRKVLRVGVRVRGGILRRVVAELRDADRQRLATARRSRLSGRGAVRIVLRKRLAPGTYRVSLTAVAANGATVRRTARVVVVRSRAARHG